MPTDTVAVYACETLPSIGDTSREHRHIVSAVDGDAAERIKTALTQRAATSTDTTTLVFDGVRIEIPPSVGDAVVQLLTYLAAGGTASPSGQSQSSSPPRRQQRSSAFRTRMCANSPTRETPDRTTRHPPQVPPRRRDGLPRAVPPNAPSSSRTFLRSLSRTDRRRHCA